MKQRGTFLNKLLANFLASSASQVNLAANDSTRYDSGHTSVCGAARSGRISRGFPKYGVLCNALLTGAADASNGCLLMRETFGAANAILPRVADRRGEAPVQSATMDDAPLYQHELRACWQVESLHSQVVASSKASCQPSACAASSASYACGRLHTAQDWLCGARRSKPQIRLKCALSTWRTSVQLIVQ